MEIDNMRITGMMFYYYFVCKRKLWCFYNNIQFEKENENVLLGKLIDDTAYGRDAKHIMVDETINIDFIKDWKVIHEIKKSKSVELAAIWQVKYYIYLLKEKGIRIEKGILDYPKIRKREEVFLQAGDVEKIVIFIDDIEKTVKQEKMPDPINSRICKNCAYYEYCYI